MTIYVASSEAFMEWVAHADFELYVSLVSRTCCLSAFDFVVHLSGLLVFRSLKNSLRTVLGGGR